VIDEQQRQPQGQAAGPSEANDLEPPRPRAGEPDREKQDGEQQEAKSPTNHLDLAIDEASLGMIRRVSGDSSEGERSLPATYTVPFFDALDDETSMKAFQPADHLHSRTYLSLLVAQFLAAFNDQAIHASAMFFAINTETMSEARAISLMPILFYAPWAIFCTIAGYFADRYSKRVSLITWKVVEVAITLLALGGFWLGRHGEPTLGAWVVLGTVFLMGMHSAFFVPAKYGAMPEILTPRMLSKGNGVLESLSFLAVILGTVAGGVLSTLFLRHEYMIGLILTALAIVGAFASLFIEKIPAANSSRPFPPYIYQPLIRNIRGLLSSRPLIFAVVGIAFFTFLVSFMRAVVYMHGQSQLPPWSEARTSYTVGMVALGIGLGSPLVGYLSGDKVEVGLVPVGALGMMTATTVAALCLDNIPVLMVCIVFIGFFTGFYLVPLFSLLQHRAPKTSKGDAIATSNFINITGAIASSLVFAAMDTGAVRSGFSPPLPVLDEMRGTLDSPPRFDEKTGHFSSVVIALDDGTKQTLVANYEGPDYVLLRVNRRIEVGEEVVVRSYGKKNVTYRRIRRADQEPRPVYDKSHLPSLLFLSAGAMTLFTLALLWYFLPDLFRRTLIWWRTRFRHSLETAGMLRLPPNGPALIVSDAPDGAARDHVLSAADRVIHFLPAGGDDPEATVRLGRALLARGEVVSVTADAAGAGAGLLEALEDENPVAVLPVHWAREEKNGRSEVFVVAGSLLAPGSPLGLVREELDRLRVDLAGKIAAGVPLEKEEGAH
jgi:MFS family permease